MSEFGRILKKLRKDRNMSQEDLAKALGVSRSCIGNYEQGTREPTLDDTSKIASYFGIPIDVLIRTSFANDKIGMYWKDIDADYSLLVEEKEKGKPYYINEYANRLAEFLRTNSDYKVLFDASRNVKPEDIEKVTEMIKLMTK